MISLEFWPIALWTVTTMLAGYMGFELGRMSRAKLGQPGSPGCRQNGPKPETLDPGKSTKPKSEPEPEEWVPAWLWEWAKAIRVKPTDLSDLYEWGLTLAGLAFTQFGGGVSAKCHLHPIVRVGEFASEFDHIPAKWRSLRALERLQQAWRRAGLVELPSQRKGLILTEVGLEELQVDPERWYP